MTKEYTIYTSWLAYELRKAGFPILRTGINENHPQFDTYIFEDSESFQRALARLSKRKRR